jgi:hypothetical protein
MPAKAEVRQEVAKRRARAINLRRAGTTWQSIADALGYKSRADAHRDVTRALQDIIRAPVKEYVAEEIDRLDAMMMGLWANAMRGDVAAIDRVLRIQERRARYLGLDKQPAKTTETGVSLEETQGRMVADVIRRVLGELELSESQASQVPQIVPRHLRALTEDTETA